MKNVLVIGGSNWVATHIILELLKNEYFVKISIQNLEKKYQIKDLIDKYSKYSKNIDFCKLNILSDELFDEAMKGVEYVIHTASPNPIKNNKNLIKLLKDSTLRVLKFAEKNKVKRVIITSSQASMTYGNNEMQDSFNEHSWTNVKNKSLSNYIIGRTIAEKKAWEFCKNLNLDLYTIHSGIVLGPILEKNLKSPALQKMKKIICGETIAVPNRYTNPTDVRDLAKMHVKVLQINETINKRFPLMSEKPISFLEMSKILRKHGYSSTRIVIPNVVINFLSIFSKRFKQMSYLLSVKPKIDISITKNHLGFKPIPIHISLLDMAKSIKLILNK